MAWPSRGWCGRHRSASPPRLTGSFAGCSSRTTGVSSMPLRRWSAIEKMPKRSCRRPSPGAHSAWNRKGIPPEPVAYVRVAVVNLSRNRIRRKLLGLTRRSERAERFEDPEQMALDRGRTEPIERSGLVVAPPPAGVRRSQISARRNGAGNGRRARDIGGIGQDPHPPGSSGPGDDPGGGRPVTAIEDRLRRVASTPVESPEFDAIVAMSRRLDRRRRAGYAVGGLMSVALVAGIGIGWSTLRDDAAELITDPTATTPVEEPPLARNGQRRESGCGGDRDSGGAGTRHPHGGPGRGRRRSSALR